jgi:hypothetical protein
MNINTECLKSCFIGSFQGHDTTSAAISWALFMLGLYPDVQVTINGTFLHISFRIFLTAYSSGNSLKAHTGIEGSDLLDVCPCS